MTVYTYSRIPALNPNTSPMSVAKSASGSVYDINDTGFLTPLNMTLVATNAVVTTIASDANGIFPDFTLLDRTSCVFKAASGLPFVLTTTTPVPGPAGGAGPTGAQGPAGIADDNSVAQQVTNGTATKAALSATYLDKASAATTYAMVSAVPAGLGSGTTNVATQIQAILDSADTFGAEVYFPDGTYRVDTPLEKFHRVRLSKGATITAGAPGMAAVVRTRLTTRYDNGSITGKGAIDANTNAAIGIHIRNFLYFDISGISVNGGTTAGIKAGDSTAAGRSAEAVISKVRIINNNNVTAGSRGILVENSGDHSFEQILIQNYDVGMTLPVSGNAMAADIHVWTDPTKGSTSICFEDYSNNSHYTRCHADTPTQYGWRIYGFGATLIQCGTYNNPTASYTTDNVMVGVKFEGANAIGLLVGHFFLGGSSTKRLKSDVEAADGKYGLIQSFGCTNQFLATPSRTLYNRSVGAVVRDTVTAGLGFSADAVTPTADLGLSIKTNGLDRWKLVSDGAAETGSDAGTGLSLRRYSDAGVLLSDPIFISRSSGTWVWKTAQSILDGNNIALGTGTGTKLGTGATQKLGFYGLTPVVQQVVAGARGTAAATASLTARLATLGIISDTTTSPISAKTTSSTLTSSDRYVISNGGTLIQTLPDPTTASVGYPTTIKNVNASNCTVQSLGGGLIDGAASKVLAQWASVTVISDGTQWLTV